MKWLNSHQVLLWVIITVASGVAYIYTTFATAGYVDTKVDYAIKYVDVKHESAKETLLEIKSDVKEIKQELFRKHR
jgi:hypothetical protein